MQWCHVVLMKFFVNNKKFKKKIDVKEFTELENEISLSPAVRYLFTILHFSFPHFFKQRITGQKGKNVKGLSSITTLRKIKSLNDYYL